jgi:hypothetical protein
MYRNVLQYCVEICSIMDKYTNPEHTNYPTKASNPERIKNNDNIYSNYRPEHKHEFLRTYPCLGEAKE